MAIEQIELELIHDNPYQARLTYHRKDIDELAHSIKTHGLLQVPPGRRKDGNVELGFGHLRKRAFDKLAKKEPEKWGKMPVDIRELSDDQMALFALEENLKRRDISPLETARAVDKYLVSFPGKTEVEVAESLNMTKGNVSNMRRVLRLPEEVLEKIDEGRINFHQGRELLVLEKLENPKELMLTAIRSIRTEDRPHGHANTVEGMQLAVHGVVGNHCRPLDKQWEGYRWDILFDTRTAGCLECERMIRTHPTKSATAHYCTDEQCWDRHQEEHKETAAAEAKARMEAEILKRAAEQVGAAAPTNISQEMLAVQKKAPKRGRPIPVVANATGVALPVPCETCTKAETCDRTHFHISSNGSDRLVCEEKVKRVPEELKIPSLEIPQDILTLAREKAGTRAEVLDLKDLITGNVYSRQYKAGYTVLKGSYHDELRYMDDPIECTERCTQGFHYAFDSSARGDRGDEEGRPTLFYVCSNQKCLSQKKAAFTRAKNAEGLARKNAERKAIQEAISGADRHPRGVLMLILYTQIKGSHIANYYGGDRKKPEKWLWDKVSAGTKETDRTLDKLMAKLDKMDEPEMRKALLEMMFYYLVDHGDTGAYEIKTEKPLQWLGVDIQLVKGESKAVPAEVTDGQG